MTALTKDRNTPRREGEMMSLPVAANAKIFAGSLVVTNATGYAAPGSTATTLKAAGRAEEYVDNTGGADGAVSVRVRRGVYKYDNSGADQVTQAHVMGICYIVDDQTVAATNGVNTRSEAGKVVEVEADGVWVEVK